MDAQNPSVGQPQLNGVANRVQTTEISAGRNIRPFGSGRRLPDHHEQGEQRMSRIQLALNVPDLDSAVEFYAKLFDTQPNKRKPGYANFAVAEPALKLVLFEAKGAESRLNHLGVEVASVDEVGDAQRRLQAEGLSPIEENGTCCFAKQNKIWVDGPDGAWEIYTVVEDSEDFGQSSQHHRDPADPLCCASVPEGSSRCC
jgi:lactoylglutathione lyase